MSRSIIGTLVVAFVATVVCGQDASNAQAQQAIAGRRLPQRAIPGLRETVDPQDDRERVLIDADGRLLVLEARIRLDGQPFRVHRERLIDEALAVADADGDGKATWKEAFANPRFGSEQFSRLNPQQLTAVLGQYDANGDELVDRVEVRRMFAVIGGGTAFRVHSGASGAPDVLAMLDADSDGSLSAEELAEAGRRLKERDADDDDLLTQTSFYVASAYGNTVRNLVGTTPAGQRPSTWPVGPEDSAMIHQALQVRAGGQKPTAAALGELGARIDRNDDGMIQVEELAALREIEPDIAVRIDIGNADGTGLAIVALSPNLSGMTEDSKSLRSDAVVETAGLRLALHCSMTPAVDFSQAAAAQLRQLDKDSNGYIDEAEIDDSGNVDYFRNMFKRWDANADGKVFVDEIVADRERQNAPLRSQVQLAVVDHGRSLFAALDANGDGRLGLREMVTAGTRLRTFDADGDGRLQRTEIPGEIRFTFTRGGLVYSVRAQQMPTRSPATIDAPKWFVHMDRNGDGDVTPREFLGSAETFRQLDANADGFLDRTEAVAAGR